MIKRTLPFLLIIVLLYACVNTEVVNKESEDKIITFSSIRARATQTAWERGDKIGVFMVRESAPGVWETVVDDAFNKCYQTMGDGMFAPATDADVIRTPRDGQEVNFVAYYPYNADLVRTTPCLYLLDMSNQEDVVSTNFMVSRNLEGVKVDGSTLTLDFTKPLSRILINVSSEFDASLLEGLTVSIHGIKYSQADYAMLDKRNTLSNLTEDVVGTMALVSADGLLAEASLLAEPNILASGGRFVFTLQDGRSMTHTLTDAVVFEAGKRYTYHIRLKDGGTTEDFFEVLPQQLPDLPIEGGTHLLSLLSKKTWVVKSMPDWVTCTPNTGKGGSKPQELVLSVGINNSNALLREGEIVFEDAAGTLVQVSISQSGYPSIGYQANMRYRVDNQELPAVVIYPSRNSVPEELRWSYYSSTMWNAKLLMEPTSWVRFSYPTATRNYLRPGEEATFTIDNNNSLEPREVIVKMVDYDEALIRVYKIVQQGTTDYLEASQSKFNSRGKGDKFDFVVSSRTEWQAEQVPSWITLTRGATISNKTPVTIVCAANQGTTARSASVLLRSGSLTQTIEVSQNAKKVQSYPFSLSYYAIVHAFAGADFKFVGTSQGTNNYANTAEIVVLPGGGMEMAQAYGPYGFVVNPPLATEFKSSEVSGGAMRVNNYKGNSTVIGALEVNINYNGWTYIRRAAIFNLPVPASLTEEDKLVYTIKMTNIRSSGEFNYSISYEIH